MTNENQTDLFKKLDFQYHKPKSHIVQIGDPVLKKKSLPVPKEELNSKLVKNTIEVLKDIINRYNAVGVAAPQIGVPLKITCVQLTEKQHKEYGFFARLTKAEPIPKQILINPTYRPLTNETMTFNEGCLSMLGFSAMVPRFKEIEVEYTKEDGELSIWRAKNYTARILQHEIDHLEGKLFVEKMKPESLAFGFWEMVNQLEGNFSHNFAPNQLEP